MLESNKNIFHTLLDRYMSEVAKFEDVVWGGGVAETV